MLKKVGFWTLGMLSVALPVFAEGNGFQFDPQQIGTITSGVRDVSLGIAGVILAFVGLRILRNVTKTAATATK